MTRFSKYILHKLQLAGVSSTIIDPAALAAAHSFTQGNPRLIDNLMTDALTIGSQHKNQKCLPKRQCPGENTIFSKRKCNQEMDAEISKLGPGIESADCLVWRTAYQLSVKKKSRNGFAPKLTIPASFLFRRHLYYCQDFPILFQRSGVGSAHKKQSIQCLICHAKKSKKVYKIFSHGYTVNRKTDSTTPKS